MPEITDPDDRAVADGLRRAVATLPATGGDWGGVVRRSRRRRRQELAMRTGIPALCVAVLAGGAFALGRRSGGGDPVVDRPTTTAEIVATTGAPTTFPPEVILTAPPSQTPPRSLVTTVPVPSPVGPATSTGSSSGWPKAGGTDAFGTSIGVHATTVDGIDEVCVAAVRLDGLDAGGDACGSGDWFAVMLVGDQLTVVGAGQHDTPVLVTTTAGQQSVSTWSFAARQVWAAVLPAGVDLVSVDGSTSAAECPYRELIPAITASGSTSARVAMTLERCNDGVAFGSVRPSREMVQGGGVILERTGGRYELVNLGLVCERDGGVTTEGVGSISDRESAACAKVGL